MRQEQLKFQGQVQGQVQGLGLGTGQETCIIGINS